MTTAAVFSELLLFIFCLDSIIRPNTVYTIRYEWNIWYSPSFKYCHIIDKSNNNNEDVDI